MAKNTPKYHSYREAWSRINDSIDQGFFFEAVTICESVISDRLLSYILGVDPHAGTNTRTSFDKLIKKWRKLAENLPNHGESGNLADAVDAWRMARNSMVHGMVKTMPGTATESVDDFISRAERAASDGKDLARAVCDWHKAELSRAKE